MDYYGDYRFKPYVSVGARRAQAVRELAKLKKKGRQTSPVIVEGRTIARTIPLGDRRAECPNIRHGEVHPLGARWRNDVRGISGDNTRGVPLRQRPTNCAASASWASGSCRR